MAQLIHDYYYATGRRKRASARVFIKPGKGEAKINGKDWDEYFGKETIWNIQAAQPLAVLSQTDAFDLKITVAGGGVKGQAGAIAHGLARALDYYAEKNGAEESIQEKVASLDNKDTSDEQGLSQWHKVLRKAGLLTRDPRKVYRKKVGLVKARKKKQFSKR